ncbi:glucosidase 2 subunit beta-like isoform X2 [Lampris incognitus]|uniref:glucosidase 2 subunit beta-like isoform X2 n=1 Tax=Lampris incognitus TaxID=2546036 RepID=UPI0024B5CBD5|nr:glucosidase 2 subunit beta-like isoform X2 [Lampris incognitus]
MRCQIIIAATFWSVCVDSRKIRGISLSYKRFYRERKSFLCIDGSRMVPFEQVNDDYCDCEDGSDEPGTAACPNGRFYCTNLGFRPHYIPSSRVNDGICDCCDTSDEYNSLTWCLNSCRNLGQRERADLEGRMRTLDEGLRLKQQLIEEGVHIWREKQTQLIELQQVAEDLQVKLEEHRRRKNTADRLREQTLMALEAEDNGPRRQNRTITSIFHQLDSNNDGSITVDEVQAKVAYVEDEERILSEDEAVALLGGGHQMDLTMFQHMLWNNLRSGDSIKIKGTHGALVGLVDEDPNIKAAGSAAERAAADLKKVEEAFETVNMEISDLTKKLTIDYGADREYLFMNNQCYQLKVYEYTYTLCPFNQVTQKDVSGTEVSLGTRAICGFPTTHLASD